MRKRYNEKYKKKDFDRDSAPTPNEVEMATSTENSQKSPARSRVTTTSVNSSNSNNNNNKRDIMLSNIDIGERLGGGAFGDVYRAVWDSTTPVAVKKLTDSAQLGDFRKEAGTLRYACTMKGRRDEECDRRKEEKQDLIHFSF